MGKLTWNKGFMLLAVATANMLLGGCKHDVFNPEKVKATYQDRFPVKDIDPLMDWKMTQKVRINVSIHEDAGTDYTIRIYDQNPLSSQSGAKVLAEGTANNTTAFTTVTDCPTTLTHAFVCRTDAHGRHLVKYVSIDNGQINATFSGANIKTRAAWTRSVNIETYSPKKSEAEIKAMLAEAEEIRPNTKYKSGGIYKIPHSTKPYQGKIGQEELSADNPATIIIEGIWEPNGNNLYVEDGFEFYVPDGGKIVIPDTQVFTLKQSSRFNVFPGGTITGSEIRLENASGNYNYNAGIVEVSEFTASGQGVFYNCGTLRVTEKMDFSSSSRFINQGKAYIKETDSDIVIDNGCYLYAEEFEGTLNMGSNSSAEIEKLDGDEDTRITMDKESMITITDEAELEKTEFTGPDNGYALVKINKLENIGKFKSQGNIYYEVKEIDSDITDDSKEAQFLEAIKNSNGTISKWGDSPIVIPEGDCTGTGNTPNDTGSEITTEGIPYTYVFEDNFPLVGDYDFNDVVLDVVPTYHRDKATNHIKRIQLNVTLAAAGASKAVGVGLRIVGIRPSDIRGITTGGDDSRFQQSFASPYCLFSYDSGTHTENDGSQVIIPIAGEVHEVFGTAPGTLVNTGGSSITAPARTYEITVEPTDQTKNDPLFSKDNLDFFICYSYKGMKKRMEVHLYEFWSYGATAAGTIQQENLDVAGNNTWAICVPYGFKYPKELINISRTDEPEAGAYPRFIDWARNRDTYKDWYKYPVEENTYR